MIHSRITIGVLSILALAFGGDPAGAQVTAGDWDVEVFAGAYSSGIEALDEETLFGLRVGHSLNKVFGIQTALSFTGAESSLPKVEGTFDWTAVLFDASFLAHLRPDGRLVPTVYAGLGWADVSGDATATLPGGGTLFVTGLYESTLTLHGGVGSKLFVKENIYLRLAGLARWYDARDGDDVDWEATLGIGYKFGG
jgi:hypothetical protein